jgi:hypothetical protein
MTPGPGNELTPCTAGHGHLRASYDDREHVVDFLKAAFVQGRLAKEELEARTGQALSSRTYAELAKLTADLPGGSIGALLPRQAARARARRLPLGKVALVATGALGPPAVLMAALITGSEGLARVFALIFPWYFMGWLAAVWQIIDNLRQRSRGPAGHRLSPVSRPATAPTLRAHRYRPTACHRPGPARTGRPGAGGPGCRAPRRVPR